ncbi:MAG TPA: hypothetical protein PLW81_03595 [Thiobacillaceae bacterium]|nr:hypothetical protein [Thiobacillaceae bacterium]
MRIFLPRSLAAWQTPEFRSTLKDELERLDRDLLPLQQGLSRSSHALPDSLEAVILGVEDLPGRIGAKVALFYSGIIAGCSCADDPTPVDEITEHCEIRLDIRKDNAETTLTLLD